MTISPDLFDALLSHDGVKRRAGEDFYNQLGLDARVQGLVTSLQSNSNISHFQLAAVLLRREVVNLSDAEQLQQLIKPLMLLCAKHDGIADCIAEICASLQHLDKELSVKVVQSILQSSNSLPLWIAVAERAPQTFATSRVWSQFPTTDNAVVWLRLVVAASLAVEPHLVAGFQQHVATVLPGLPKSDPKVWELLIQVSDEGPSLLGGTLLEPVLLFCTQEPSLHSVQVIVNLLNHCNVGSLNIGGVLSVALSTCWEEFKELDDDEDQHAQALVAELLRFPGVLNTLQPEIENAANQGDFKRALLGLQCCLEGAPVSFQKHIGVATQIALGQANGTEAYQSIRLLGMICEIGSSMEEQPILQTLAHASNSPDSRVAILACQSLVSYCRPSDDALERTTAPYLADVLQAIAIPMQSSSSDVQIAAAGAIACWAEATQTEFAPFYSSTVPALLRMAQSPNEELSEACLEAATIIGQAVPTLFAADAHTIMEWALPMLREKPYMLPSCARIASVLGESYARYLNAVIPLLLQRASQSNDIELSEGNFHSLGKNVDVDSTTIAIPGKGLMRVTLNTTMIQEKAQVIRSVYEHAVAIGASFGPYCSSCLEVLIPLIDFQFSSDIRGIASQTAGAVFEAFCEYGAVSGTFEQPRVFLQVLLRALSAQLPKEDMMDVETVYALADALSDTTRAMHLYTSANKQLIQSVQEADVESVVVTCMKCLTSCLERRAAMTASYLAASEDERYVLSNELQEEENLLTPLVDTVGYLLKTYRDAFMPIFKAHVVPVLGPFLSTGDDLRARLSAVCLFDDCVECCGAEAAATYAPMLLQGIHRGLDDTLNGGDSELKRAAIYGVAQIARYAPHNVLLPVAQNLIQLLASIATSSVDHEAAVFENAVSALASLALFNNSPFVGAGYVKRQTIMEAFLDSLPLSEDPDEAKICHAGLCDLLEAGSMEGNTSRIAGIIGGILSLANEGEDVVSDETRVRLQTILAHFQRGGGFVSNGVPSPNVVSP